MNWTLQRSIVVIVLSLVALLGWLQWQFIVKGNEQVMQQQVLQLNNYYLAQIEQRVQEFTHHYEELQTLATKRLPSIPANENWRSNAEQLMFDIMQSSPQLYGVFIGTSSNDLFGFVRIDDGTFDYMVVEGDDPSATIRFIEAQSASSRGSERLNAAGFMVTQRSWFQAGLTATTPQWSAPFQYYAFQVMAIPLNSRIAHPKPGVEAVLSFNLYDSQLRNELVRLKAGFPGELLVLDEQQNLLAASSTNIAELCAVASACFQPLSDQAVINGKTFQLARGNIQIGDVVNWQLVGIVDPQQAMAATQRTLETSFYLVIASLLIVALVFLLITRQLLMPLRRMSHYLNAIWRDHPGETIIPPPTMTNGLKTAEVTAIQAAVSSLTNRMNQYLHERQNLYSTIDEQSELIRELALIPQSTETAFARTDKQARVTWVNRAFERLLRTDASHLIGRPITELLALGAAELTIYQSLQTKALLGQLSSDEVSWCQQGEQWLAMSVDPIAAENSDETLALLHVIRDISETKRYERELELWHEVYHHAQWGLMITTGTEPVLQRVNPYICKLLGYQASELEQQHLRRYLDEQTVANIEPIIARVSRGETYTYDGALRHKEGHWVAVRVIVDGVFDADGNIVYRVGHVQAL